METKETAVNVKLILPEAVTKEILRQQRKQTSAIRLAAFFAIIVIGMGAYYLLTLMTGAG